MKERKNVDQDVPGNAIASAALFQSQMIRSASTMLHAEEAFSRLDDEDIVVQRVVVRLPQGHGTEYVLVCNAIHLDEKLVAFHRAASWLEVLVGFCERLKNGSLKWQPDKYA